MPADPPTPAKPPKPQFLSHGAADIDSATPTTFVSKPRSGHLATILGGNTSGRRYHFNPLTAPSFDNMLAAQYAQADNMAVLNDKPAMDDYTSTITSTKFPSTAADVRKFIITGVLPPQGIAIFLKYPEPAPTLRGTENALVTMLDIIQRHYAPANPLEVFIHEVVSGRLPEQWYNNCITTAGYKIGTSSIPYALERDVQVYIRTRINHAISHWQDSYLRRLEHYFDRDHMCFDVETNATFRKVSFATTADVTVPDFNISLNVFGAFTWSRPTTSSTNGARNYNSYDRDRRPPHPGASNPAASSRPRRVMQLPESGPIPIFAKHHGKPFAEACKTDPDLDNTDLRYGKHTACGRFGLNGTSTPNGCRDPMCGRVHVDKDGKVHRMP